MFKKANFKPMKHSSRAGDSLPLGYPGAKISLKEEVVPTLFPVVEAMLIPLIRRTQAATRALSTMYGPVHLGLKRVVSTDRDDVGPR